MAPSARHPGAWLRAAVVGIVRRSLHAALDPDTNYPIPPGVLSIGDGTYGRPAVHHYPGDPTKVVIGRYCSIAEDVELIPGGGHRVEAVSTYPFGRLTPVSAPHPVAKGDIVIGNDVWLGRGAKVLSGVSIGDGAVIGAYAVVATDVRPYAIVAGSPAREIRRRFDDDTISELLKVRWWDWDRARIVAAAELLAGTDIGAFLRRAAADRSPVDLDVGPT